MSSVPAPPALDLSGAPTLPALTGLARLVAPPRLGLYLDTLHDIPGDAEIVLPPGHRHSYPLVLPVGGSISLITAQVSHGPDYAIRYWISLHPGGAQISVTAVFHMRRPLAGSPPYTRALCLQVAGSTPPADALSLTVPPGRYYLNCLNLTNAVERYTLQVEQTN